jgi:hypothetical protein
MKFDIEFTSNSPFLPAVNIPCYSGILETEITNKIRNIILREESNILTNTPLPDHETDPTWLTGRLWNYNFLDFKDLEIDELYNWFGTLYKNYVESVGQIPEPVYIQCWANLCRPGGRIITKHNHASAHAGAPLENSYISGNLFLGPCTDTKTYYQNPFLDQQSVGIPNLPGMVVLFPSYVNHWIDKTQGSDLRMSIAFDIITQNTYDQIGPNNFKPLLW